MTKTGSTMAEENSLEGTEVLCAYLEDELEIQTAILARLGDKERHLRQQDLPALSLCLGELGPLLGRLDGATQRRQRLIGALAQRIGIGTGELTLSRLATRMEPSQAERLAATRDRLQAVLGEIGRANRRNQVLVRNGVELNQAIVRALFGSTEERKTYDQRGAGVTTGSSRHRFQREV